MGVFTAPGVGERGGIDIRRMAAKATHDIASDPVTPIEATVPKMSKRSIENSVLLFMFNSTLDTPDALRNRGSRAIVE
jgi:hypothetical protein